MREHLADVGDEDLIAELERRGYRAGTPGIAVPLQANGAGGWPGWLSAHRRLVLALALLACLVAATLAVLPSFDAIRAWLAAHSEWTIQVGFLTLTAVIINAAWLLLQVTILDPLLIGPELIATWLAWRDRYMAGARTADDGAMMIAGAIYGAAVIVMMGVQTAAVFYVGTAM